jgi:hypothetical protein
MNDTVMGVRVAAMEAPVRVSRLASVESAR